jgi:type II secretion system protein G
MRLTSMSMETAMKETRRSSNIPRAERDLFSVFSRSAWLILALPCVLTGWIGSGLSYAAMIAATAAATPGDPKPAQARAATPAEPSDRRAEATVRRRLQTLTEGAISDVLHFSGTREKLAQALRQRAIADGLNGAALEWGTHAAMLAAQAHLDSLGAGLSEALKTYFEEPALAAQVSTLARKSSSGAATQALALTAAVKWASGVLGDAASSGISALTMVGMQYPGGALFQLGKDRVEPELRRIALQAAGGGLRGIRQRKAAPPALEAIVTSELVAAAARDAADKRRLTRLGIQQLVSGLAELHRRCGLYPDTREGLQALLKKPKTLRCGHYDDDGFVARVPADAWGESFRYRSDGIDFELTSLGADRAAGGLGAAMDLVYRAGAGFEGEAP